jgi:hypothetical protein
VYIVDILNDDIVSFSNEFFCFNMFNAWTNYRNIHKEEVRKPYLDFCTLLAMSLMACAPVTALTRMPVSPILPEMWRRADAGDPPAMGVRLATAFADASARNGRDAASARQARVWRPR